MAAIDVQPSLPFDTALTAPTTPTTPTTPTHPRTYASTHDLIFVRHPRARRYVIRVADDGTVRVTVPRWGSRRVAAAFAEQERAWIEREQRRIEEENARPRPPALPPEEERLLRHRAKRELPARLLELASAHGISVTRVSVRNQRWRWGSCSRAGHVCLNWRLIQTPDWVRDYVMIHELMHLRRMDHSPRFWKLVAQACPSFKEARAWLRDAALNRTQGA